MKAAAKYLFDESFASGEKPTITMVEHERRRVDENRKPIERALRPERHKRSRMRLNGPQPPSPLSATGSPDSMER